MGDFRSQDKRGLRGSMLDEFQSSQPFCRQVAVGGVWLCYFFGSLDFRGLFMCGWPLTSSASRLKSHTHGAFFFCHLYI